MQDANSNDFNNYEDLINKHFRNCDDFNFWEKLILLLKKYKLIEYDEFPVINKVKSQLNGKSIAQINYIEVTLSFLNVSEKMYYIYKDINDFIPINFVNEKIDAID